MILQTFWAVEGKGRAAGCVAYRKMAGFAQETDPVVSAKHVGAASAMITTVVTIHASGVSVRALTAGHDRAWPAHGSSTWKIAKISLSAPWAGSARGAKPALGRQAAPTGCPHRPGALGQFSAHAHAGSAIGGPPSLHGQNAILRHFAPPARPEP